MRIFINFREALDEVKRDLKEMGIRVQTQTMQDKDVSEDPMYETLELQNYGYVVTHPNTADLSPTQPWADKEFTERVSGEICNPGEAWESRSELWEEFLEPDLMQFAYTYAARFAQKRPVKLKPGITEFRSQLEQLLHNMNKYPDNRNHVLSVWEPGDLWRVGDHRVPCSITYHFLYRNNELMLTYYMRSCDFITHMENDLYLAARLQEWVAVQLDWVPGRFTSFTGSLHAYQKDLAGVF